MAEWTPTMVADRIESAADVFRALPEVKPQGYFNAWPEYFHSFADQVGQEPRTRRPKPGPRDITQAEDALLWLRWLEPADARLPGTTAACVVSALQGAHILRVHDVAETAQALAVWSAIGASEPDAAS